MFKLWKNSIRDGFEHFLATIAIVFMFMIGKHGDSLLETDIMLSLYLSISAFCLIAYDLFHDHKPISQWFYYPALTFLFLLSAYRAGTYGLFLILEGIVVVSIPILAFFVAKKTNSKVEQAYFWYCCLVPILPCAFYIHI